MPLPRGGPDGNWNAVRAYNQAHGPGAIRSATQRRVEYACAACGHEDCAWNPVEPPDLGWIWVYKCPKCGGFMLDLKAHDRKNGPDYLPNVIRDWEPFTLENAGHEPVVIHSRKHYRQVLQERGLRNQWEGV